MNTVWIVLPILVVLMFQLGIELDGRAFLRVARSPRAVAAGLIGQLAVLPAAAFGVAAVFGLEPVWFLGLMLVACCPGGSSSNVFTMLSRGDVALSVTLTALSSLVTLFTLPALMAFAAHWVSLYAGAEIELPVGRLVVQNIVLLFLPMACGTAFRRWRPRAAQRVYRAVALMLLAGLFFVQYAQTIVDNFALLGAASATLILAATGAGALLARLFGLGSAVRRTIVIEVGMQNAAQAIAVASSPLVFACERMAIPAIVYALVMNIVLLLYLALVRRRAARG